MQRNGTRDANLDSISSVIADREGNHYAVPFIKYGKMCYINVYIYPK